LESANKINIYLYILLEAMNGGKDRKLSVEKPNTVQTKKYKKKEEFVSTTSFFTDQYITNEQIVSLHHALFNIDVIHTINHCSTSLGNSCKQTMETLKRIHTQFDVEILDEVVLQPLVDSYFVGVYHLTTEDGSYTQTLPIFLTIHGDFKDYRQQFDYWVDYEVNARYKDEIEKHSSMKPNQRRYYSFQYKSDFYNAGGFKSQGEMYVYTEEIMNPYISKLKKIYGEEFEISPSQMEKIKSQLFDIDILTKTVDIQNTTDKPDENYIIVGVSEYTRNHPSRYIYMDVYGRFLDVYGNFFWPLYETSVVKININGKPRPYGIYLFHKVKSNDVDDEKLKEELVEYNYYFHFPQQKMFDEITTALAKTLKTLLLSMTVGLVIDAGLFYETYLKEIANETSQISSTHAYLVSNHTQFRADVKSLKDTSDMSSSQIKSMEEFVKNYKWTVHHQLDLKATLGELDGTNAAKMYAHIKKHNYNKCSNSIQKLLASYNYFDFPKASDFKNPTECQSAFLKFWEKKKTHFKNTQFGDGKGIGHTDGYWYEFGLGNGSQSQSEKVFNHLLNTVSNKIALKEIINDKTTIDKYLNTTVDPAIIESIAESSHISMEASTSLTMNSRKQDIEAISNMASDSIAKYNDKTSEYRKNCDKTTSAFLLKNEIDSVQLDIDDVDFKVSLLSDETIQNEPDLQNSLQKEKDVLATRLLTLQTLQKTANEKEGIPII